MKHIDHIGIAVKNIDTSLAVFERLMNTQCYKKEIAEEQNVCTAFLRTGETKIELLEDLNEAGIISRFIEKKGEGIHHIAFETVNISDEIKRLKEEGFIPLNEIPVKGADNKLVCFFHPKSTNGILIELCEEIKPAL